MLDKLYSDDKDMTELSDSNLIYLLTPHLTRT